MPEVLLGQTLKELLDSVGLQKEIATRAENIYRLGLTREPRSPEWLLSVLLCNTRENAVALRAIRQTLWTMGLPVKAWLLEWKEHLFNEFGNETYEPIFSVEDLRGTARSMVKLSTSTVGQGGIRYDTLAAEIREPNVNKARRMVQRIGVVTQRTAKETGENGKAVSTSTTEWRLAPHKQQWRDWIAEKEDHHSPLDNLDSPDVEL